MIDHFDSPLPEQFNDFDSRRVTGIVNIFLERDPQNRDSFMSVNVSVIVEHSHELIDDVIRHRLVHARGKLNEIHVEVKFASLPGEVVGINGDAMTPDKAGLE